MSKVIDKAKERDRVLKENKDRAEYLKHLHEQGEVLMEDMQILMGVLCVFVVVILGFFALHLWERFL